jgi:hypothetical protein
MSLHQKVSNAIRILRWDRDVSARASHLVVKKDLLITYESVILGQAGSGNVSGSTFSERKIMSTKTSIKRIAAVAAVAITLGGVSAVSAHAVVYSESIAISSATSSAVSATAVTTTITDSFLPTSTDSTTATAFLISAPAGNNVLPSVVVDAAAIAASTNATVTGAGTQQAVVTAGAGGVAAVGVYKLSLTPVLSGTYVVKVIPSNSLTNSVTWTVTVAAKPAVNSAVSAGPALFMPITGNGAVGDVNAALVSVTNSYRNVVAQFEFNESNGLTSPTPGFLTNLDAVDLTVQVTGPGLASFTDNANYGQKLTTETSTNTWSGLGGGLCGAPCATFGHGYLHKIVFIWGDGQAGTGTVTVSAGGVTLLTKPVIFYGATAKIKATQGLSVVASGAAEALGGNTTAVFNNYAVQLSGTDSLGTKALVDATKVTAVSSDGTVIPSTGISCVQDNSDALLTDCSVTSAATAKSGSSASLTWVYTVGTTVLNSDPVKYTVGDAKIASVSLKADADSYNPGDKVTLTMTALDASGNPVADKSYTNALAGTGLAANALLAGSNPFATADVRFTSGAATSTFFAPFFYNNTGGVVTLSGKVGTGAGVATALQGTSVSIAVTIANPGQATADAAQAAIDAAQEATDAANAAYDAANNAMDSADAATAAAQDASDNASAALAAVTSLSATVAKLVSSVAALASALTAIKKKLGVK